MTSPAVEEYLRRLRAELAGAGAADADELVVEVRSLLADAEAAEPGGAEAELARLGEPEALARAVMGGAPEEDGGMSSGLWWRLGVAAPVDIAVGLAVPVVAAPFLYTFATDGTVSAAVRLAVVTLGAAAALAWPVFAWRSYRRGGSGSLGLLLAGIEVLRGPGFRVVRRRPGAHAAR